MMKDLKKNSRLEEIRKTIPKSTRQNVEKLHAIADRIFDLLQEKGIDQRNLAKSLGKYESEVSKWMAGKHNFTIQSILNIEAVLGEDIIQVPKKKVEPEPYWIMVSSRMEKLKALAAKLKSSDFHYTDTKNLSVVNEPHCKLLSDIKFSYYTTQILSNEGNWKDKEEFEQTKTV